MRLRSLLPSRLPSRGAGICGGVRPQQGLGQGQDGLAGPLRELGDGLVKPG
jgi:hypothetical protein